LEKGEPGLSYCVPFEAALTTKARPIGNRRQNTPQTGMLIAAINKTETYSADSAATCLGKAQP
jgi:hypothetical protein